jgi:hypothetical protein
MKIMHDEFEQYVRQLIAAPSAHTAEFPGVHGRRR